MMLNSEIIQSQLLLKHSNIIHGVSTKHGGNTLPPYYNNLSYHVGDDKETVKQNRDKFFSSLGINQQNLAVPQQVHSDNVKIINKPGYYPETDALITKTKNVFLIVSTADCYSILVHDPVKQIVAAVHSGWRGAQKNILTKAVNIMIEEMGCRKSDLLFFVGPGISRDNFEVGNEVAEMFESAFAHRLNGKCYIDLKANILHQLQAAEIKPEQIETIPLCTYNEKDYLHSYRRDSRKSGRMFSVIGMR